MGVIASDKSVMPQLAILTGRQPNSKPGFLTFLGGKVSEKRGLEFGLEFATTQYKLIMWRTW